MYFAKLKFSKIPDIGFAMAHYRKEHTAAYGRTRKKAVEIAYINSGELMIELYKNKFIAHEGSVVVLFRNLPIVTHTSGDKINSHYTVLAEFEDYEFELLYEDKADEKDHLIIPFITPPSPLTEKIRKKLCNIASAMKEDSEKNSLLCSINFLSVLCELSKERYNRQKEEQCSSKKLSDMICRYIDSNLDKPITMDILSRYIGKSPNYTGYVFKKTYKMSIAEYVNMKKAKKIAFLIHNDGMTFKAACECVALSEITYGYRLFKKYIGLTPNEYMKMGKMQKYK